MGRSEPAPTAHWQPDGGSWPTAVTEIEPNVIVVRGYPIDELMGRITFSEAIWLTLLGELPDERTRQLFDAILVASLDHGPTSPSANTARLVASTGAEPGHAAAAGLLAINRYHGGALSGAMEILEDVVSRSRAGAGLAVAADAVVAEWRARGERLLGFGHRFHSVDPRIARLFAIADELGFHSIYIDAARAVERALLESSHRAIPINPDGAIAALFCGIGVPVGLADQLFMIARFVGLNAQAYEETTRMRPMRKIRPDLYEYDGPTRRHLEGRAVRP